MSYEEAIAYLDSLLKFGVRPGLERITALAEAFGNPQERLRVVHITGTNGKGSTAAFIASVLREAGYCTGLYLSPYVHDLRERIQIDGRMIPEQDFADIVGEIKPVADAIAKTELGPVTEFEVKTMACYLYMARREVDLAVLEVGMGGRFDSTNLVRPLVAVITNVGLDHTDRLGDTVEKIASEKAGIIKTGTVVVTAAEDEAAWRVILAKCREEGAEVWRVLRPQAVTLASPSADVQLRLTSKGREFSLENGAVRMHHLSPGLPGAFQHINAATAVAAVLALARYEVRITEPAIRAGIANAYVPGRLEVLRDRPTLVIDGAHNPDAARALAEALAANFRFDRLILVIGMLETHPPEGVVATLVPKASAVIATQSKWHLALPAEKMAAAARKHCPDVEIVPSVPEAVQRALDAAGPDDLILVTGSFYTIGEVPVALPKSS